VINYLIIVLAININELIIEKVNLI